MFETYYSTSNNRTIKRWQTLARYDQSITFEASNRGLCRMKMLPVMILANYHSSVRSAVSERPNSSARLVSRCPNSSARLVSQCPNSSARLVFPMFQVELRLAFECSNSNTNDHQFEVCVFGWVFFTIIITFCHSMAFMSMY